MNKSRAIEIYEDVWVNGNSMTQKQFEELSASAPETDPEINKSNLQKIIDLTGFKEDPESIPENLKFYIDRDLDFLDRKKRNCFDRIKVDKKGDGIKRGMNDAPKTLRKHQGFNL